MPLGITLAICTWAIVLLISIGYTGASPKNKTIDDKFEDPAFGATLVFHPRVSWKEKTCPKQVCGDEPDKAQIPFNGTWKAATSKPGMSGGSGPVSIDLAFKGTAIYLYFITEGQDVDPGIHALTLTECNITLDGRHADSFQQVPIQSPTTNFKAVAFQNENLSNVDHNLTVSVQGMNHPLFVNFDYAEYTFEDDSPDSVPSSASVSITTNTLSTHMLSSPKATPGIHSTHPGSPFVSPEDPPETPETLTSPMSSSITIGNPSPNSQSSPSAPTKVSTLDSDKKAPVGSIIGGTIGGLALIIIIIFLLRLQCHRRKRQRGMASTPAALFSAQNPSVLERIRHRNLRFLPNHDSISFKPQNEFKYGNYDAEPPHHPSSSYDSDESDYTYASREKFGYTGKQAD